MTLSDGSILSPLNEGSNNFLFAKYLLGVFIVYIQYFLLQLTGMSTLSAVSLMSRMCRCYPLEEDVKEQI